ncbi:MAG: hypothetical protein KJ621_13495 [Proteobacteria bacterium]|nr:hypothetical protein [Pseudomonadota bacterium]MBU1742831.1 hypothetical protein [Pseudomonadota bacterium]
MGTRKPILWISAALVATVGLGSAPAAPLIDYSRPEYRKVVNLRRQISLLNLVNGLDLTPVQVQRLVDVLDQVRRIKREAHQDFMATQRQRAATLWKLRNHLIAHPGEIPKGLRREVGYMSRIDHRIRDFYQQRLRRLELKVQSVLKPHQIYLVQLFRACLIPPKDIRGPARIGANDSVVPVPKGLFKRVRRMPEWRFERAVWIVAQRIKDRLERRKGVLPRKMQANETKRLVRVLTRVRRLNQAEYEINKAKLAAELYRPYKVNHKVAYRRRRGQPGLLGRYFFQPQMLEILRMKAARLAKARTQARP